MQCCSSSKQQRLCDKQLCMTGGTHGEGVLATGDDLADPDAEDRDHGKAACENEEKTGKTCGSCQ
jgi:hypothetical protein